ncbi:MAG: DUF3857 domain-containing protein [Candidatus Krumholzibacteriia bacterium]
MVWKFRILTLLWDADPENALRQNIFALQSFPQSLDLLERLADLAQWGAVLRNDLFKEVFPPDIAAEVSANLFRTDLTAREDLKVILKRGAARILQKALDVDPGNFEIRDRINGLLEMPPFSNTLPDPHCDEIGEMRVRPEDYSGAGSVVLLSNRRCLLFDRRAGVIDNILAVQILTREGAATWENIDLAGDPFGDLQVLAKEVIKEVGPRTEGKRFLNRVMFPGLAVGDILLLHYRTKEFVSGNLAGNFWDQHSFSFATGPCVRSRYELILPAGQQARTRLWNAGDYLVEGYPRQDALDGMKVRHTWIFADLPASADEPLAPSDLNTMPWLDVSTIESWDTIAQWYCDIADGQAVAQEGIQARAAELTEGCRSEDEAVARIFDFVAGEINYESVPLFQSGFIPRLAGDVLADGYGDCKDKACLMIALLAAAGHDGFRFALVTPGAPGDRPFLPSPRFNHAIVFKRGDNGRDLWLDPTFRHGRWDRIPSHLAGSPSLVAAPGITDLMVIPGTDPGEFPYVVDSTVSLQSNGDGLVDLEEVIHQIDHIAWIREELDGGPEDALVSLKTTGLSILYPGAEVLDAKAGSLDPMPDLLTITTRLRIPELGTLDGGILSLHLPWNSQLTGRFGAVVAKSGRTLPLDLRAMNLCEKESLILVLPPDFTPTRLPTGKDVSWGECRYATSFGVSAEGVEAHRDLVIKGEMVDVEAYPGFKAWLDEVRRDLNRIHHFRAD